SDVTLLTYVFENFRDVCFHAYNLNSVWYYTAPGLTFDAALKDTGIELDLLTDYNMVLMKEKGIQGGISQCCKGYCEENNKRMDNYDSESESTYLTYYDINNLYGLGVGRDKNFRRERKGVYTRSRSRLSSASLVSVNRSRPLHNSHSDLLLCPENKTPPGGKHK
ncbi:hypothetical protein J437_LFUL016044, partial [Ladona fulva]